MLTRAAVVLEPPSKAAPGKYQVVDIELDEPRQGEIRVKLVAAGLCHSDDHVATGDMPVDIFPWCGGREGSGIVTDVGPSTPGYAPGDHVVFSFIPACGRCRWCSTGRQNLCDLGATLMQGHATLSSPGNSLLSPEGREALAAEKAAAAAEESELQAASTPDK